jgi:hypothetical protein
LVWGGWAPLVIDAVHMLKMSNAQKNSFENMLVPLGAVLGASEDQWYILSPNE